MVGGHHESAHPDQNPLIRYVARHVPVARGATGGAFFLREHGKLFITPLLMALITIELSDLMFAIDSIPAVLSITRDPFIVFTSNVFAILGLRALYFALADLVTRLRHLASTIAAILIFVGVKMIVEPWLHIPIGVSLGIIGGAMILGTVASLLHPLPPKADDDESPDAQ
jgi:tellurite resistance protein TerC